MSHDNLITQVSESYIMTIKDWDKIYQKWMDVFRNYLKNNQQDVLTSLNNIMFHQEWDKYASGTISSWEMEILCFYYHEHELINVNMNKYGLRSFALLPPTPQVEKIFKRNGKEIPLYKLDRICGTCVAKDKDKATVYLLTTSGVVTVKFRKEYFTMFDKQISEKQEDGTKKVKERSWFKRGSMIVVTGHRNEEEFIVKKYSSTPGHQLYKIDEIVDNGDLVLRCERYKGVEEEDND